MSETFSIIVAQWIGSVPLRAPTADGSPNQVLQTDGSGNLSFVTITSGITIDSTAITSGAATRILFENASNQVSSSANFTYQNSLDDATGNEVAHTINYTTNKATSGDDTGLLVNKTDTASPGTSWLQEWQVGGSPLVQIHDSGIIKSSVPSGNITSRSVASSASARHYVGNNGVGLFIGIEDSSGGAVFSGTTAYSGVVGTAEPNRSFHVCTHNTVAVTVDSSQNVAVPAGTLAISGAGAAEIPLSVELAAAQSANAFEINSNGGSGGDDLVVESGGYLGVNVDPSSIANPGTISVKNIANYAFNCDGNILHKSDGTNYVYMGKASTWSGSLSTDYMIASYRPKLHLAANGAGTPSMTFTATGTGIGTTSPAEMLQVDDAIAISSDAEGSTARLTRRTAHETHTLAAAGTSDTTTISIPSGARLLGVSFNVNTAVSDDGGDDTWSAAFVTGSTTTLATAAAAAQNTKVNLMLPDEISTGVCQIRFTANGGSFDAGVIEIVAYYEELTSLANV